MNIKFLKAGTGDSIIIHHKSHNIIIDGGNDSKYLISEIDKINKRGEFIDLLVVTHHDDDHIRGIIDLVKYIEGSKIGLDFIKEVIFNSPRKIHNNITEFENKENYLSYKQANELEVLLSKFNTKWDLYANEKQSLSYADMIIEVFSPKIEILKTYGSDKGAYLTSDFRLDWNVPLIELQKSISDDSKDDTLPNQTSIVLKIKSPDKTILLTADATPNRLDQIIEQMFSENDNQPVKFDFMQMPHHGSYRSITKSILEKIECSRFIISTNSIKHNLPNKRAILKVLNYTHKINDSHIEFIFNYNEVISKLKINQQECLKYKFKLCPNNESYGISI